MLFRFETGLVRGDGAAVEAGADDAACCPTQRTASAWGVTNAGLERVSNEILGTLSLADPLADRAVEGGVGRAVPPEKRPIGVVFQNYALWPHMSVAENIGVMLRLAGRGRAERRRRAAALLE